MAEQVSLDMPPRLGGDVLLTYIAALLAGAVSRRSGVLIYLDAHRAADDIPCHVILVGALMAALCRLSAGSTQVGAGGHQQLIVSAENGIGGLIDFVANAHDFGHA